MRYDMTPHRHADTVLEEDEFRKDWLEIKAVLDGITDQDIIDRFPQSTNKMSISSAINDLIRDRLVEKGWDKEPALFSDPRYLGRDSKRWRLDFAKEGTIGVEVAFNHGEAMAWNLLKPVISGELNHVKKDVQTKVGVIILATDAMKKAGAFDGAVGSYEKALRYLAPMNHFLTVPLMLIGLKPPKSFIVEKVKQGNTNIGVIKNV